MSWVKYLKRTHVQKAKNNSSAHLNQFPPVRIEEEEFEEVLSLTVGAYPYFLNDIQPC